MIQKTLMVFGPGGIGKTDLDHLIRGDVVRIDPYRLRERPREKHENSGTSDLSYAHMNLRPELQCAFEALGDTMEFPTKSGHRVKLFPPVRTPPGTRTPATSVAAWCCRRPRCTRRSPPAPPPAWRSPHRGPAPSSTRRRSSPSARCPSSPPAGSCCR